MIALAVANTVTTTMQNHYYTFGGFIHRQKDGSAIGSDLSGELARNVMTVWDMKFLAMLKANGIIIDMYSRYVDDQLEVCPPIMPGWDFCVKDKKMKYSEDLARTDIEEPAIRTARILQKMANTINPCIQLTFDTP